ncbi:MAG: hypothetical protein IK093_19515 [Ruminiclostridium sp.]|nr:hypothetical protein [Ruminiclostridium sp.]
MKQSLIKKISYIACCAMLTGAVGATAAYAVNENTGAQVQTEEPAAEEKTEREEAEPGKDETVYVLANANGSTNKVIVSDHLSNPDSRDTLTETSSLTGVTNVKGDETYSENGGERTWNAAGKDIYYQGTSNEELPIDMKVTYTLDGEEIAPEALAGRSGRVTVRFDYTNNKYEDKVINGETSRIYVPFAAVTGVMLDNDRFGNVTVTNGKTVNDGDRTFVIGMAFPGMAETIGSEIADIPGYFEIAADVTDFEMTNTVTLATNEMFNGIDLDLGDKEGTLTEDIDKLTDAMNNLMDGSDRLHEGLAELLDKSSALTDGVSALYDGAAQLKDGANAANDGAAQLYTGSEKLSAGLDTLNSNSASLSAGSEQVFNSLLDMANTQLEAAGITGYTLTIDNYAQTLDAIIASLDGDKVLETAKETAMQQVTEVVEANRAAVEAEVTKAVKEQVSAKVVETVKETVTAKVTEAVQAKVFAAVLESQGMTPEAYEQAVAAGMIDEATQAKLTGAAGQQMQSDEVKAQIEAATEQQMQSDEVKAQIAAATEQQMQSDEITAMIAQTTDGKVAELIEQNYNSKDVQDKIKAGLSEAKAGVKKLSDLKDQLDSYNTFYTGLAQYTEGVAQAADGAKQFNGGLEQLSSGTAALANGSGQLCDGIAELDGNVPALIDGITQLTDGSEQLSDGCRKFNDEGVSKIVTLVDGDLGGMIDRLNAVSELSEQYGTYTGGTGSVKFIYRTAAIEK